MGCMINELIRITPTQCKECKKQLPRKKLIYSPCYNDWLCLDCYKAQFKPTPMHPTPIFIKRYSLRGKQWLKESEINLG